MVNGAVQAFPGLEGGAPIDILSSPWQKSSRHSTGSAQARTALLLGHILPVCSLRAPCPAGAAPVSVLAGLSPRTARSVETDAHERTAL